MFIFWSQSFIIIFLLTLSVCSGSSNRSVSVLEMCLSGIEHIFRVKSLLEVKSSVQEIQQYFIMKKSLGLFAFSLLTVTSSGM